MQRLQWLGWVTIGVWGLTLLISLSMMWDREWMESNPPSEILTGGLHWAAVVVGAGLASSLFRADVRRALTGAQRASFTIAGALALVSGVLFFNTLGG